MKNSSRKPESFIKNPNYPGGKKALDEFIKSNLRYPEEAIQNKISGTVTVEYDVDVFGKVTATRVKHGIGYGCDEEAKRLVSLLKYPKKRYQGLHVAFHMAVNINFQLHEAAPPPPQQQTVVYHYVEKKS